MTFAHAAEKVGQGQSGRSRVPTDDREKFGAERLHPMIANWRCRPTPAAQLVKFIAGKLTLEAVAMPGRFLEHATCQGLPENITIGKNGARTVAIESMRQRLCRDLGFTPIRVPQQHGRA